MFQAIPLRACLSVDLDLIIKPEETLRSHLLNIMLNGNATKAWEFEVVHRPIKLHVLPGTNLKRGISYGVGVE